MPGYPPPAPTLSGDFITISRFLNSPAKIASRLQQLTDIKFVADQVLTQKVRTSGGAVSYEVSEPLFNQRAVQAVSPGSEYPMDATSTGVAAIASVNKWGETRLTDERIKRTIPMGGSVDWAMRKVTNTIIKKVDRLALAAIASAVTQSSPAIGAWDDLDVAQMLRDIEVAKSVVDDLEMGYVLDTLLISNTKYAMLLSDEKIANLRRRETTDNPVYGGTIETFAGLKVVTTALANLPGGTDDPWLVDSTNLGAMADETEIDPGYATGPNGTQVKSMRRDDLDAWDLQARRITVPVVQEPGAGIRITGTTGSYMDMYQVVGECAHVVVETSAGRVNQLFYKPAILPAGTDPARIKHLLSVGLIAKVGGDEPAPVVEVATPEVKAADVKAPEVVAPEVKAPEVKAETVAAAPSDETSGAAVGSETDEAREAAKAKLPADGSAPALSASTAVWLEYVVAKGYGYDTCKDVNRAELIKLVTQ